MGETPLNDWLYAIVPGFILSTIAIIVVSLATGEPNDRIKSQFDDENKLALIVWFALKNLVTMVARFFIQT